MKVLLWIAGIWLFILILIKVIVSPEVLDRLIDRYAAEYVDGKISLKKASISTLKHFPNLSLTLEDFSITYPKDRFPTLQTQGRLASEGIGTDADTLASFERFTVGVNVAALAAGKISIPFARLAKPRIFARRYSDGDANWNIFTFPADTSEDEGSSGLPEIRFGRISLSDHPHIVFIDEADTLSAMADVKSIRMNGRMNPRKSSRNRIGMRIDSLMVAGRTAADTLAFALESLSIGERGDQMRFDAHADIMTATRALGRMNIPIDLSGTFSFPKDSVPSVSMRDFRAEVASIPLTGGADLRFKTGRTNVTSAFTIPECRISDIIDDYLAAYIPALKDFSTDAVIGMDLHSSGDYVHADGSLPEICVHIRVPESSIKHKPTGYSAKIGFGASADVFPDGKISAEFEHLDLQADGVELSGSVKVPDIMEDDMLVNVDGKLGVDLNRLASFIPDTLDIEAGGNIKAEIKGSLRPSHLGLYTFSGADLKGSAEGSGISLKIPKDSISVHIDNITLGAGPEIKTSQRDKSQTFKLLAITGSVDHADIGYGTMELCGEDLNISAMNSSNNDTSLVSRVGGRLNAGRLTFKDASGTEILLRGTGNSFQIIPKKDNPTVPVLTITSSNKGIGLRDGTNRIILTDAKIKARAGLNTVERRQRSKRRLDSLAMVYPDIPRDSLLAHARAMRQTREIPEWLREEEFRKKDISIHLDETLAKYFREWDINGDIDVRSGALLTPYFPLRNTLNKLEVSFTNDRIGIDTLRIKSGQSILSASGEMTGLQRALLGRGRLNLKLGIDSDRINANELLTAYSNGSRFIPSSRTAVLAEASDEEMLEIITSDTLAVTDTVTPLIVIPANLNAEIDLKASGITYSDLTISRLSSHMTMKERCIQISNTNAVSNMGGIEFEGFYATRSKQDIKAGFSFNFNDITAEKVINLVPAVDTLMPLLKSFYGLLNCELAATAAIDTNMNIITPSINGIIRIGGKDLSIKNSEMFRDLAKKLMFRNKNEGYIDEMSVEGVIADNTIEVFPFVVKLDRYTLALSGIQNMDQSFRYHASLIRSPFLIKLGIDLHGESFDQMKFKIGKAKYKSTDVPVFSAVIDQTKINLVRSIRGIFEKGVEAAVSENERQEAIRSRKEELGYISAVDQQLEELSEQEMQQIEAEENAIKENEAVEEAIIEAVQETLNL